MKQQPSMIQIQRRYIDTVNTAEPRYRALIRGAARERAERDLRAWGFNANQIDRIIDEARAVEVLEREVL